MRHRRLALALLAFSAAAAAAPETPLTLDQAMAHPDWIGPPVEAAWWSLDGQRALYTLKRAGSPVRDTWSQAVVGGPAARPWQKPHIPNRTGTAEAYRPPGHEFKGGRRAAATGDYEPWTPS